MAMPTTRELQIGFAKDRYVISPFEERALRAGTASGEVEARLAEHVRLCDALQYAMDARIGVWMRTRSEELLERTHARVELDWSAMKVQLAGGQQRSPFTVEELTELHGDQVVSNGTLEELLAGEAAEHVLIRCRSYLAACRANLAASEALKVWQLRQQPALPADLVEWLRRYDAKQGAPA